MSATEAFAHALAGSTGVNKKKELASRRVSQITPVTTDVHHVATPHTSTPSSTSLLRAPLARAPSPQPQPHIPSPTEAIQTIRRNSMDEPIYDNKETHLDQAEIVYHFKGSWDCFRQVIAREGWTKLYTGLNSALIGVGASSAVYFFWYYLFKRMALARSGRKSLGPIENLGIASIAGIVNVFMTLPIWVVNTRMTLTKKEDNYQSVWDATQKIVKAEGISGLYKGLIPSLILVSNPAIQFVAYEQMIRIIRRARHIAATDAAATAHGTSVAADTAANALHLSSLEYFLLGAIAKAIATVATYPYQVVKSRQQAHRTKHIGTWEIIQSIIKVEGYRAFYSGMGAKMSQTVLNSAFMFAVYEKLVRLILDLMQFAVKKEIAAVKS